MALVRPGSLRKDRLEHGIKMVMHLFVRELFLCLILLAGHLPILKMQQEQFLEREVQRHRVLLVLLVASGYLLNKKFKIIF